MVKTITLQIDKPQDQMLHLILPPDLPDGLLDIALVIVPVTSTVAMSSLAGRWQAYFSSDFDIDAALDELLSCLCLVWF
jgi:hypothetical protein